jgi:hypothetical protein
VHGLERELAGRARVIHLNVDDEVGARARAVYGIEKVPAVILLTRAGSEAYRTEGKLPRTGAIRDAVEGLRGGC